MQILFSIWKIGRSIGPFLVESYLALILLVEPSSVEHFLSKQGWFKIIKNSNERRGDYLKHSEETKYHVQWLSTHRMTEACSFYYCYLNSDFLHIGHFE